MRTPEQLTDTTAKRSGHKEIMSEPIKVWLVVGYGPNLRLVETLATTETVAAFGGGLRSVYRAAQDTDDFDYGDYLDDDDTAESKEGAIQLAVRQCRARINSSMESIGTQLNHIKEIEKL